MWDIVDKLAQWPSLQYGVVVIIVVFSVMTYAKVLAAKFPQSQQHQQSHNTSTTSEVSFMYFQGWFKSVLDGISELRTNQELNKMQTQEKFGEKLRETRHDLKASMASMQAEIMGEIEKLSEKFDEKFEDSHPKRNR